MERLTFTAISRANNPLSWRLVIPEGAPVSVKFWGKEAYDFVSESLLVANSFKELHPEGTKRRI